MVPGRDQLDKVTVLDYISQDDELSAPAMEWGELLNARAAERRVAVKKTKTSFVLGTVVLLMTALSFAEAQGPTSPPVGVASPADLSALLKSGKWVIVEFGGEHCIPCRAMQPILQKLRDELAGKVEIRNFWVQEHPPVARQYRVMVIPTQVVFNPKGEEVFRHMGYYPLEEFRAALAEKGLK